MNIADGMRNITENIIASHQVRVKALGSLVKEVSETIRSHAADRKAMSKEQAAELARFTADIASSISAKLKGFQKELELVAKDRVLSAKELKGHLRAEARGLRNLVKKNLSDYSKDHAEMSEVQRRHLHGYVNGIRNLVKKTLSDYSKDHAEMGETMRHNLHGYVKDIVKAVGDLTAVTHGLMSGYRADIRKAGNIWGSMTNTIAKAGGKKAALPVIRAEEKIGTVKEAVRKVQKRKRRKK